jgi:hypothetical protein
MGFAPEQRPVQNAFCPFIDSWLFAFSRSGNVKQLDVVLLDEFLYQSLGLKKTAFADMETGLFVLLREIDCPQ